MKSIKLPALSIALFACGYAISVSGCSTQSFNSSLPESQATIQSPVPSSSPITSDSGDSRILLDSLSKVSELSDAAVRATRVKLYEKLDGSKITGEPMFKEKRDYWMMRVAKNYAGPLDVGNYFYFQVKPGEKVGDSAVYILTAEPHGGTPAIYRGLPVYGLLPGVEPMKGEGKLSSPFNKSADKTTVSEISESDAAQIFADKIGSTQREISAQKTSK